VALAYGDQPLEFGPDYLIPKPFDSRLITELPIAVARAAMESGVATRPIENFRAYREQLSQYVVRSGLAMKPIMERARAEPKRVIYAEGEEERVLHAVQVILDEGIAIPIVIGRRDRVVRTIEKLGLHIRADRDFELVDPFDHPYYKECWQEYHRLRERYGVDPSNARIRINTRTTVLGAILVKLGYGDALICGAIGSYQGHLKHVIEVMGLRPGIRVGAGLTLLITAKGTLFLADTHVNLEPDAEDLADITLLAAEGVRRFGITPKVALLSHSNFGSWNSASARKMARTLTLLRERAPELEVEGEMQADVALSDHLRERVFPNSRLEGSANLLVMPTLDAANIAFNLLRSMADGVVVGPMLLGLDAPAHVLPKTSSARRVVNMSAVAVVDAQVREAARAADAGHVAAD
jgi:malate dehydrogenase (oxaloacetate-decarboxylating)(NADP+)